MLSTGRWIYMSAIESERNGAVLEISLTNEEVFQNMGGKAKIKSRGKQKWIISAEPIYQFS